MGKFKKSGFICILIGLMIVQLAIIPVFGDDFTSIYDELKSQFPQIIVNLKSEGASDSDIEVFLTELSDELSGQGNLTESNFDSKMYQALKSVLFVSSDSAVAKTKYYNLALALVNKYAKNLSSSGLTGDLLSLRNVVASKLLAQTTGTVVVPAGSTVPPVAPPIAQTIEIYERKKGTDGIERIYFDQTKLLDQIKATSEATVSVKVEDMSISTGEKLILKDLSSVFLTKQKLKLEFDDVKLTFKKDKITPIDNTELDIKYVDQKISLNFGSTNKDLYMPIMVQIPYVNASDKNTFSVVRVDEKGVKSVVGGYFEAGLVKFLTDLPGTYYVEENIVNFDDLNIEDYWAVKKVNDLASKGIIGGRSTGVFDPSASITRAEFATLITKMLHYNKGTASDSFTDVKANSWYTPYVTNVNAFGLMDGKGAGKFDPEGNITQQEILIVLSKILNENGVLKGDEESASSYAFKTETASAWATDLIENAVSNGALTDIPLSKIDMKKAATRLETVNMLYEIQKELYN